MYRGIQSARPLKTLSTSPLTDQFIPTPIRRLWKAFSHATITARRLFTRIFPPLSVARYLPLVGVQLHHHFASRFLIDCLHHHGLSCSYQELHQFQWFSVRRNRHITNLTTEFVQYAVDSKSNIRFALWMDMIPFMACG